MSLYPQIKQFLLGKTLPTSAHAEERLSNAAALAVLSSDALSSVAYATEEILLVLVAAGSNALGLSLPYLTPAHGWSRPPVSGTRP